MGNTVLWKPSDTAVLSNYIIYQLLEEAGMPAGVISYLPSDGPVFGNTTTDSPHLAAVNFTGSVPTFKYIWRRVGDNLDKYKTFPRLIGGELFDIKKLLLKSTYLQNVAEKTSILFILLLILIVLFPQRSDRLMNTQAKNVVLAHACLYQRVCGILLNQNFLIYINKLKLVM